MKNIFICLFILFSFTNCAPVKVMKGDITVYNDDGTVLKNWNNVVIGNDYYNNQTNTFKFFGMNFYDNTTKKYVILSNALPYIVQYKVYNHKELIQINNQINKPDKKYLKDEWINLETELISLKTQIKNISRKSNDYIELKNKIIYIQKEQDKINSLLYHYYGGW